MSSGNDPGFDSTATRPNNRVSELLDGWQATRAQTVLATRFVANKDDYLATEPADIGRAVGDNLRELFVSCDPAPALLQQFDHARPEFIAVHDIGTTSSRKFLAGVAEASGLALQRLVIRRQGFGTTLASLEFIEFPGADGSTLRIYSTEVEADTVSRQGLARVLLAYSRLGVLMVGDLPAHSLAAALKPLRDDIITGPWPNRDLLLLPLASNAALASQGSELGRGIGVTVRTTPPVVRPSDAWNFISGSWGRLRAQLAESGRNLPALATLPAPLTSAAAHAASAPIAPVVAANRNPPLAASPGLNFGPNAVTPALQPMSLKPMPEVQRAAAGAADIAPKTAELMTQYVEQLRKLGGMLDCCVFEAASGRNVAHTGEAPDADSLAAAGAALLASIVLTGRRLGLATDLPDAAVTLEARHLVLRPVPRHPALMLHAVLDKSRANLTLARLQIQRMDDLFNEQTP